MRLFLIFFFAIYGSMHLYVFLKARAAFGFGMATGVPLGLFMLFMVSAPVVVRLSERAGLEGLARALSLLAYTWLGVLFLFLMASLAVDAYRGALYIASRATALDVSAWTPSARAAFTLPLALAVAAFLYGYYEARNIHTEHLVVKTTKALPEGMQSLRIVQISDVHLGLIVRERRLRMIIDKVRALRPDMLVSTGDLVDGQINNMPGLAEMLRAVQAPLGKFAITGNHEYYAGLKEAVAFTERAGFKMLRDEALSAAINIAGIDDPTGRYFGLGGNGAEQRVLGALPAEKFTLLLKHRPLSEPTSIGLFDLQLSGHSHRGQIFPFNFVVAVPYPMISGSYDLGGGSALYVSRGSGTWGPPIRILSPPEVTLIEIIPEAGTSKEDRR